MVWSGRALRGSAHSSFCQPTACLFWRRYIRPTGTSPSSTCSSSSQPSSWPSSSLSSSSSPTLLALRQYFRFSSTRESIDYAILEKSLRFKLFIDFIKLFPYLQLETEHTASVLFYHEADYKAFLQKKICLNNGKVSEKYLRYVSGPCNDPAVSMHRLFRTRSRQTVDRDKKM